MIHTNLQARIEHAFSELCEKKALWSAEEKQSLIPELQGIYQDLSQNRLCVTEKKHDQWIVHAWIKKAILLSFTLFESQPIAHPFGACFDKIPLQTRDYQQDDFQKAGFRMVPGAIVRAGAYIAPQAILMPCFINVGAHVGQGSMVDTWATVGSCAFVGDHVHLSGGVGIGGVLEPLQNTPTIIEDHCFIGARSEIVEGVIVGEGSVISMGVFIGQSTKIYDRARKTIHYGFVPPYSVVVPGSLPAEDGTHALSCAVIIKTVDKKTREKTGINALLREAQSAGSPHA